MLSALTMSLSRLAGRHYALARDVLLVLLGSAIVALGAQVAVYLPFTPVPISGQTFAVLLVGAALGSRRGAASLLTYVAQGAMGLPVFAGGTAGLAVLMGPRGGYLLGMIVAAYLVGWLVERGWDRHVLRAGAAMLAGNAAIYLIGLPWLALFVGGQMSAALNLGLYPFLVGDGIKLLLAAAGLPLAKVFVDHLRGS